MDFNLVPEAVCIVDKVDLSIKRANSKFSCTIAPLSKFKGLNFLENFIGKEEHSRFQVAVTRVQVASAFTNSICLIVAKSYASFEC